MTTARTEFLSHLTDLEEWSTKLTIQVKQARLAAMNSFGRNLRALDVHMHNIDDLARKISDAAINAQTEINIECEGK